MKNLMILVLVVALGFASFTAMDLGNEPKVDNQEQVVNEVFAEYHPLVITAFDKAEKQYIKKVVIDEVEKMDPDPKKCICKGTGLLPTDGSVVSYCKYHGNRSSDEKISKMEARIEQLETELSKDLVIDAPIIRSTLEGILKEREAEEAKTECTCTPEEAAAGTCPCGPDCKCHEDKEEAPEAKAAQLPTKPQMGFVRKDRPKNTVDNTSYQVIMFSAKWCAPCQAFESGPLKQLSKTVEGLEFSASASADFRVLDIDSPQVKPFYLSSRKDAKGEEVRMIPMFLEIKDNVVISKKFGVEEMDLEYLLDTYDLEETR